MKSSQLLATAVFCAASYFCFSSFSSDTHFFESLSHGTAPTAPTGLTAQESFRVGVPVEVSFALPANTELELSAREQTEQVRDWLLLTILKGNNLDLGKINEAAFDMPPIRYGYLVPVSNMEYGPTRARMVGEKQALALIPVSDAAQKQDNLALIADALRKDNGSAPETIKVYAYQIDLATQKATITKQEELDGKSVFSGGSGYFERTIGSLDDLRNFMGTIDDLTFASNRDGQLTLGGRKLKSRSFGTITVEDIAAIWQSEDQVAEKLAAFNRKWDGIQYSDPAEGRRLQAEHDAEHKKLKIVDGSGFSLDPFYDFSTMAEDLPELPMLMLLYGGNTEAYQQFKPRFEMAVRTGDENGVFEAINKVREEDDLTGQIVLQFIQDRRFQKARYDGDLKGTAVGMHLFYTDLIAKIWGSNVFYSAPVDDVPDFMHDLKVNLSKIYKKEAEKFSQSRLWFGKDDAGIQFADGQRQVFFKRKATRIFEASSDPYHPGAETPETAFWSHTINWWNNHYEEVAAFEPEYERLNEIIKWSAVIGWLNNSSSGSLAILRGVPVKRDNWFPEWAANNRDLKFGQWPEVGFKPRGFKGQKEEVMPILVSPPSMGGGAISGGVSLASKAELKAMTSIAREVSPGLRRSFLKYGGHGDDLISVRGAVFKPRSSIAEGLVEMTPKEGVKLRNLFAEVENTTFTKTVNQLGDITEFGLKQGEIRVGRLDISKKSNGFDIGFQALEMDEAQLLARKISDGTGDLSAIMERSGLVDEFQVVDLNTVVARTSNSDKVAFFRVKNSTEVELAEGLSGRVSGNAAGSRIVEVKFLPDAEVASFAPKMKPAGYNTSDPHLGSYRNGHIEDFAKSIADNPNPVAYKRSLEASFEQNLKMADDLARQGRHQRAAGMLQEIERIHGLRPEVLLKRATQNIDAVIAHLRSGDLSKANRAFGQISDALNGPKAFRTKAFSEFQSRLAASDLPLGYKNILQQGADFIAGPTKKARFFQGDVRGFGSLNGFKKVSWSPNLANGKSRFMPEARLVAGNPRLANMDWNANVGQTMSAVMEAHPNAILFEVPKARLKDFRMGLQIAEVPERSLVRVEQNLGKLNFHSSGPGDDDDDDEDEKLYVVVPNGW